MITIIGIDDTDNLESRGTGHLARMLGEAIEAEGLGTLKSIVRHQLLVDSRIPYTSHNSSASLLANITCEIKKIIDFCRLFLIRESAEGSDVGLCIIGLDDIKEDIIGWGTRAKAEVLNKSDAISHAERRNIYLDGLRGTKDGIIGALAATGLRKVGNDGRVLWLRNLRETSGIYKAAELSRLLGIENITDRNGNEIDEGSFIDTGEWLRPVMINGKITLLVDKIEDNEQYGWQVAAKEYIKSISE